MGYRLEWFGTEVEDGVPPRRNAQIKKLMRKLCANSKKQITKSKKIVSSRLEKPNLWLKILKMKN